MAWRKESGVWGPFGKNGGLVKQWHGQLHGFGCLDVGSAAGKKEPGLVLPDQGEGTARKWVVVRHQQMKGLGELGVFGGLQQLGKIFYKGSSKFSGVSQSGNKQWHPGKHLRLSHGDRSCCRSFSTGLRALTCSTVRVKSRAKSSWFLFKCTSPGTSTSATCNEHSQFSSKAGAKPRQSSEMPNTNSGRAVLLCTPESCRTRSQRNRTDLISYFDFITKNNSREAWAQSLAQPTP